MAVVLGPQLTGPAVVPDWRRDWQATQERMVVICVLPDAQLIGKTEAPLTTYLFKCLW